MQQDDDALNALMPPRDWHDETANCDVWQAESVREAMRAAQQALVLVAWTTMPDADDWTFISGSDDPNGKLPGKWFPLYTPPQTEKHK